MNRRTVTVANRPSIRWGAVSLIAAVILCQLPVVVASSDLSGSVSSKVRRPSRDSEVTTSPERDASELSNVRGPSRDSEVTSPQRDASELSSVRGPSRVFAATTPEGDASELSNVRGPSRDSEVTTPEHDAVDEVISSENTSPPGALTESFSQRSAQTVARAFEDSGPFPTPARNENGVSADGSGGPPGRHFLRRITVRPEHPCNRQAPSSVFRRLLILAVILFFTAFTGAIALNFKPIGEMMASDNAYVGLCSSNNSSVNNTTSIRSTTPALGNISSMHNETASGDSNVYRCNAQEAHIQGLYTVAFAAACVSSALAGQLTDRAGSRLTSFLGHTAEIIGLTLFSFGVYGPGLALLAMGQEFGFLASLSLAQLFPQSGSFIIGLLGSLASLSSMVSTLLNIIVQSTGAGVSTVVLGYAGTICLPALIAGVCLLPRRQPLETAGDAAGLTPSTHESSEVTADSAAVRATLLPLTPPTGETIQSSRQRVPLSQRGPFRVLLRGLSFLQTERTLRANLFSVPSLALMLNFASAGIINSYFIQAAERVFHGPASGLLQYFTPVAALPCVILGFVADRWGSSTASLILAVSGLIMNATALFPNDVAGYFGLIALTVYMSAITSQVFWCARELYPSGCRNTLSGILLSIGGFLSLLANLLYNRVTVQMFNGETLAVRLGLGALQLLQLLLIYVIYRYIQLRRGREDLLRRLVRRFSRRQRSTMRRDYSSSEPQIRELEDDSNED